MVGRCEVAAEFAGTALLLAIGVTAVVAAFAAGSPVVAAVPNGDLRRLCAGTVFAGTAAAIVYSPLGRTSGGHLNPAVTAAFLLLGKLTPRSAAGYVAAQVCGAIVGALAALLAWGRHATGVRVGATVPALGGPAAALAAEAVMTFLLVTLVLEFVDRPRLMPFTAAAAALLVITLVFAEAPVSGTSLNPARSLGPALVGTTWTGLWIYLVAPPLGGLAAALAYRRRRRTVACGKLIHDARRPCHFIDCRYTPPAARVRPPARRRRGGVCSAPAAPRREPPATAARGRHEPGGPRRPHRTRKEGRS